MRALIVADVHSNLEAFQSVILDAEGLGGFDQLWSVGDVVGYGPNPAECIALMQRYDARGIAGNHDLACAGKLNFESFNPDATAAVLWTGDILSHDDAAYLGGLPERTEMEGFTLVHGSPRDPLFEYVVTPESATANFAFFDTARCLVGHSHRSFICKPQGGTAVFDEFPLDEPVSLGDGRLIVNPGAVGQPRDGDNRASYAIYDSDAGVVSHHRAKYDIAAVQQRMSEAGLPRYLVERLSFGL